MKSVPMSGLSRIMLFAAAVLFAVTVFFPMWRIELTAPQYPEGLVLQLYANKIAGNVDIINGLNHYIGMKTLHTENFPEFLFLPYILGCFGIAALFVAWSASRRALKVLLVSYIIFGILAAIDFYRWNYQYGHDLDPNAAIRVPGMAYQPPLLGYKQLLNFGAYSIPDIGGWMLIAVFVLLFAVVIKETPRLRIWKKNTVLPLVLLLLMGSCTNYNAVAIELNKDNCSYCKMGISDGKFCAEAISEKGRIYKFDDIHCMINFVTEQQGTKMAAFYVHDYTSGNLFVPASKAIFLKGGEIRSPMNGGIIAFSSKKEAQKMALAYKAEIHSWNTILSK